MFSKPTPLYAENTDQFSVDSIFLTRLYLSDCRVVPKPLEMEQNKQLKMAKAFSMKSQPPWFRYTGPATPDQFETLRQDLIFRTRAFGSRWTSHAFKDVTLQQQ